MALIHAVPGRIFKSSLLEAHKIAKQTHAKERKMAIKVKELVRVERMGELIHGKTEPVIIKTVNFKELPPFQLELASAMIDLDELRRALHSVGWSGRMILKLSQEYRKRMRGKSDIGEITRLRKQFERRAQSIMEGVEDDIKIVNAAAKRLKKMPSIRKMKTILIAGYPNVGKSSILNAISESKVDVQPYPFTTKQLLIGYMKSGYRRFQLIDTPGILDREASNPVEQQAAAALKHLSKKVMFVIDPSETSGYTIEQQEALLGRLKKELDPDVLVVYSKADLKKHAGMSVSTEDPESMDKLKEAIVNWFGRKD